VSIDDHRAALYREPLDGFVRARTELSRRLRGGGDREAATAVAKLPKPSLGAWVVDRLAEAAPDLVRDLLAAAADARDAQRPGAAEALREASARVRDLLDDAGRRARDILEEAGHPATDVTVRRAQTTAQAAAAGTPAEREALLRGTLDRDLDPPGFGPTGEAHPDTAAVAEAIRDRRRPPRAAVLELPSRPTVGPDAARADELTAAVRRAEREAEARHRDAVRGAAEAERRRACADRLAADARAAEQEADAAERAAAARAEAAEAAEDALRQARAALDDARRR
jgi:hypothetical protein